MQFVTSYSGGKDGALALCRMIDEGHRPVALITTVNAAQARSWFHGIREELMCAVSRSMDIPILFCRCGPDNYVQAFEQSLDEARQMGAEACVFGDIDIADHRAWNETRCANAGLEPVLPLWQADRESLVRELIDRGFRALIKTVSDSLDASFLGQDLTLPLLDELKAAGACPCGENGEYHTFVYDGPIFAHPIAFTRGEIFDFGTHKALDIKTGSETIL